MIYKDKKHTAQARAENLLSVMTVDEKIDQMILVHADKFLDEIIAGKMPRVYGAVFNKLLPPGDLAKINKYVKENTRLGIPILIDGEGLHGVLSPHSTIFPQSIGLGCAFNHKLAGDVADVIGGEAKALGFKRLYAPDLDLAREPRWGRTEECYGEDPYLVSEIGTAYVKGVQKHGLAAAIKHFAAHGTPEGGLNLAPVHAGERELRELYLEPFAAAVTKGGAMSVMPAYSEFDGVPVHSSRFLLRKILREELGFKGTVISDYCGIGMLQYFHRIAETACDAGRAALEAGVDMEADSAFGYGEDFRQAVKNGEIDIASVDEAVLRILTLKFKLGLFDEQETFAEVKSRAQSSIALAKKAASESVVMLKNDGVLPLGKKVKKIALIGPAADMALLGDYTYYGNGCADEKTITLKAALDKRCGRENINYANGSRLLSGNEEMLSQAESAAKKSDVVVLALGETSFSYGGIAGGDPSAVSNATSGESRDLSDLNLPAAQKLLLGRVAEVGKPVVLMLYTGRPYAVGWECERAAAVLQAWYPGEQGGNALAEILFGDVSPSGKLSVSFPRSAGHLPCFYNYKPSARGYYKKPGTLENPGRDYVFDSPSALYEFGFGLSYTTFDYSELKTEIKGDCRADVTVKVKNTGEYDAYESVLLFVSMKNCPVTQPVKRLRGFEKIFLKKGESATVTFNLTAVDFSYIAEDMRTQLNRGKSIIAIDKLQSEISFRKG